MEFVILVIIAYSIRTVRNVLHHLAWWEIKEYRFERMIVHLRETRQGKMWLFGPLSTIKWVLLAIYLVIYLAVNRGVNLLVPEAILFESLLLLSIIAIYVFEASTNIVALRHGWKLPSARARVIGIFVATIGVVIFVLFNPINYIPVTLLVTDKLIGPIIAFLVFVSNRVFNVHRIRKINAAKAKIQQYPRLRVIGVTGSYGKTTTKELIAQLLSSNYSVVKTVASQNADIGIAERVLSSDLEDVDYLVVEMAAYHPGEIASSCSIFDDKISVGVVTGINEQHQSLFGSLETTRKAKFELIESVKEGGIAIFNSHSEKLGDMVSWARKLKLAVIEIQSSSVTKYAPKIPAEHFRQNLALTIAVAKQVGMEDDEINKAVSTLTLPQQTMDEKKIGSVTLIDDTFNANPDAVYAGLEYLKTFKGEKVLIVQPLIELGWYADEAHEKMGKMAASICDQIVLTNKNFNKPFMTGASSVSGGKQKVVVMKPPDPIKEGVMLFEGKEAEKYLEKIRSSPGL